MSTADKIHAAAEYLHASLPEREEKTISASVLRSMRPNTAYAKRYNGGGITAGVIVDGEFLPPIDGNRKARIVLVAPRNDAEADQLADALVEAVRDTPPPGSAYDPAVRPQWDAWRVLVAELTA